MLEHLFPRIVYHCITTIGSCLTLLGIYVTMTKSPPEMQQYKWLLIKLMAFEELYALSLGILLFPDPMFPVPAAAVTGIAGNYGEHVSHLALCITGLFIIIVFTTLNECCFVRALTIYGQSEKVSLFLHPFVMIACIIGMLLFAGFTVFKLVLSVVQPMTVQCFASLIPGLSVEEYKIIEYYHTRNYSFIHIAPNAPEVLPAALIGFSAILWAYLTNLFLVMLIYRKLRTSKLTMSRRTFKVQRALLYMLMIQNAHPFCAIMFPIIFGSILFIHGYADLVGQDSCKHGLLFLICSYPIISFFYGMGFVRPYRQFCLNLVRLPFRSRRAVFLIAEVKSSLDSRIQKPPISNSKVERRRWGIECHPLP